MARDCYSQPWAEGPGTRGHAPIRRGGCFPGLVARDRRPGQPASRARYFRHRIISHGLACGAGQAAGVGTGSHVHSATGRSPPPAALPGPDEPFLTSPPVLGPCARANMEQKEGGAGDAARGFSGRPVPFGEETYPLC
jgi:hypothetical protein